MDNYNLFDMPREKYWAPPASYTKDKIHKLIDDAIESGNYLCSEKIDGNWCAFIYDNGVFKMQTRGESTVTGTYGEIQDKVPHIFEEMKRLCEEMECTKAFVIGELYYKGGNDKDVGSILRCLPPKAIERQNKGKKLRYYIFDVWYWTDSMMSFEFGDRIDFLDTMQKYAKNIKAQYLDFADYYWASESAYWLLDKVLSSGGEGIVLQHKDGIPEPGKRPARKSIKVKKEIQNDLDVVCIGFNPPKREYTGIAPEFWAYWEDIQTGEKIHDHAFLDYEEGRCNIEPVTKPYYYGWCGSIACGAYKDGKLVKVCDVSGLPDDMKEDMKNNPDNYINRPLRVVGMEVTNPQKGDPSIRHPKFMGFRDDINAADCTWNKIFEMK